MRVYFLLPKLIEPAKHQASGGIISNLRMIEQLADSMTVVCIPMLSKSVPNSLADKQSIFIELPTTPNDSRPQYLLERYTRYKTRVSRTIKQHGPGVVLGTRATIPIAHRISSALNIPFAIITRAFEDLEQAGLRAPSDTMTLFRRLDGFFNRENVKEAYRAANLLITNSEYMKQEHRRLFATKAQWCVSYPSIDLPRAQPAVNPIRTIGFVNKGKRKGKRLTLALASQMPEKHFLVYGEPLARDSFDMPNITDAGYVSDRVAMFRSADLFLMPSEWDEPYGRVAAEAIWSGRPVIVSKKGGLPEAAPVDLFWEPTDDAEQWQKKINRLSAPENSKEVQDAISSAQRQIASHSDRLPKHLLELMPF